MVGIGAEDGPSRSSVRHLNHCKQLENLELHIVDVYFACVPLSNDILFEI